MNPLGARWKGRHDRVNSRLVSFRLNQIPNMPASSARHAGYGTVPKEGPLSPTLFSRRASVRHQLALLSAVVCIVGTLLLLTSSKVPRRTELNVFYESKYKDLDPGGKDGGDWMGCMRCRHSAAQCRSPAKQVQASEGSWGYTMPSEDLNTNACPPRGGMISVQVRRKGTVRTEWFSKEKLLAAIPKPKAANASSPSAGGNATVLCVPSPPGTKGGWSAADDCKPLSDWTAEIVLNATNDMKSALANAKSALAKASSANATAPTGRRLLQSAGVDDYQPPTPVSKWYDALVAAISNSSYGATAPPNASNTTDKESHDAGMVQPEDCHGPPSFGCKVRLPYGWAVQTDGLDPSFGLALRVLGNRP